MCQEIGGLKCLSLCCCPVLSFLLRVNFAVMTISSCMGTSSFVVRPPYVVTFFCIVGLSFVVTG